LLQQPGPVEPLPDPMLLADLHPPILETRALLWADEAACADWAAALAQRPGLQDAFIELHGPLGAGKTTFVRHLLRALGVQGRIKSPTYAVVEPHQAGPLTISHFDFYRFNDPREWADAGFRDLFAAPGLKLAEWPDKAEGQLPLADLRLHLSPDPDHPDDQRRVRAEALTPRGQALLG
jgi:tRNA threonylcarbamoyladenosine biosynthesis protein TsaE